jgi:hypothetical protein
LPVGQIRQPVRQQIVGWIERFAKPIAVVPLGAASDAEWNQFWLDLQDFLELMFQHHVDPNSHFRLNVVAGLSDADSLLTTLRKAKLFDDVMDDREIATRAMHAAATSKFAGDL